MKRQALASASFVLLAACMALSACDRAEAPAPGEAAPAAGQAASPAEAIAVPASEPASPAAETPAATPPATEPASPPASEPQSSASPPATTAETPAPMDSAAPPAGAVASAPPSGGGAAAAGGDAGAPYKVVDGYKVDAATLEGFRTWRAAACDRCHGANQEGMVGPSLIESLKRLSKEEFATVVAEGRLDKGMPAFKTNTQVMGNMDQLYAYLKGRSDGAITRAKVEAM